MELDKEELEATRNRKCEYCDLVSGEEKYIGEIHYARRLFMERHNNMFILNATGHSDNDTLEINYCPMCGRKLV